VNLTRKKDLMTTTSPARPRFGHGPMAPAPAKAAAQNARREAAQARCAAAGHVVPADRLACAACGG
jgi:hypothetical protein